MLRNKRISKGLSLLIAMILVLGSLSSMVYAKENHIKTIKRDLKDEPLKKIEAEVMKDMEEDEFVEVLVYMKDQVDTEMIAKATKAALSKSMTPYSTKLQVRKGVVEALKDMAETTQLNLIRYLEQEEEKGNVEEFKSYHIVNMMYVKASKEVIENIVYMPEVEKIHKNKTYQMDITISGEDIKPSGTEPEWNILRVGADQAWNLGYDGTGVVVGSLDSGVDWTHPALKNKWRGYNPDTEETDPTKSWFDPVYNARLPEDSDTHGTHVMGTIVGQEPDGSNPIGVAPGAKWIAARVFDMFGYTTDRRLLDAAEWMLHPGGDTNAAPDVVNNSWGGLDGIDDWYRDAVRNWRSAEIFPVFSAGNQRPGEPLPWPGSISCPANYPESYAVAAVDRYDVRASFSKLGPSPYDETLVKPNISAPGVNIYSSIPGGYTSGYSGTSMSAPHVSGTVALLLSADASLSLNEIEQILAETADPLTDNTYPESPNFGYGYGMVNAFEAVSQIASGTGFIKGRVLKAGEDLEDIIIIHEQRVNEVYIGSDIDIEAQIIDDVSVLEAELLVKPAGKSYWFLVPMNRISGDHKDGIYKATITHDMLLADSIIYKIRARDYAGEAVVSQDYQIDVSFGIVPDRYKQGFEDNALGWILEGDWQWGTAVEGFDPIAYEGEKLVGTVLGANHSNSTDSWLITPPIDLRDSSLDAATLRSHHWYDTYNDYDYGTVLVTNDYGENWTQVGPQYYGKSNEWKEVVINLEEYIGSSNPVYVGFRFVSNAYTNSKGWYIDNVRLIGLDTEAPEAPLNLQAETNVRGIKLSWDPSLEGDFDHYNVYRGETAGGEYAFIAETYSNGFIDMEAPHNVESFYVVTAVDFSGNESLYSNEASAIAMPYYEIYGSDFEEDDGGFITGITEGTENDWEWGVPTSGPNRAASGEKLWATNLSGNYTIRNDSYIESPAIYLPEDSNATLTFTHWFDFEGTTTLWDYGQVLISNDDGETWENITPTPEGRYGRRVQEWLDEEISLREYDGDTIKIRFFFHSDGSISYQGWYIDDVYVLGTGVEGNEPEPTPEPEPEHTIKSDSMEMMEKNNYVEPTEPSFKLAKNKLAMARSNTVSDREVENTLMARGNGIPVGDAIVTILETGRSVKTNPATGEFNMMVPMGEYTLRAEAYGYYSQDIEVSVEEGETINQTFILDPKPRGTITGRVFDRYYGNPASNALIRVIEDTRVEAVIADEDGNFTIPDILVGTYTLKVIADGFEPGEFTVTVNPEGITEVELGMKRFVGYPHEIIYDDGTAENALVLNSAPNGVAVRFTPEQYGKVKGLNIYFWGSDWPIPGGNRIGFTIYDIDENGRAIKVGEPIFLDIVRGEWNYIDLSSFGFSTDKDFYISTIQDQAGSYVPGTGIDESSPHGDRSYMNIDGDFQLISTEGVSGSLMMRAVMEYSVPTPVITNLEDINYTNQDTINVEGRVTADGKVNVYVNGEKVTTVDSENLGFEAEVELLEENNEIMVTTEFDGLETEPSSPVTVIKDQELPILIVEKPLDHARFNVEVVHVEGKVADNVGLDRLLINGKEKDVDQEGNFHERLILDQGENLITIKAVDLAGNETIVQRMVHVQLEAPAITNILPDEDMVLMAGDELLISFEAPIGGTGYYNIMLPFGLATDGLGSPMEEEDGVYSAIWLVPEGIIASNLQIQVIYVDEYGSKVTEIAEGKITIVGTINNMPGNTIILGDQAFDMDYLNSDSQAQLKFIEWKNSNREVYMKMDEIFVDLDGQKIVTDMLPDTIRYIDKSGNEGIYVK